MSSFADIKTADIRLLILQTLEQDPGYSANESILHSSAQVMGHKVGIDKVRTEIMWLEEQGYLTTERVLDLLVATITRRGADVAHGRATVPGVKRPDPRG
jgi:hypothetical protein